MSIRQYRPRNNRRRGISANQSMGLYFLFALAIGLQISYPLVSGDTLRYVTIFFVIAGALLMLVHALLWLKFWEVKQVGLLELMPTMILLDSKLQVFQ